MKLELDVWRRLLNVCSKFQIDLKTYIKSPETQHDFCENGTYVKKYTAGYLCTKFVVLILLHEAMIA